LGRLEQAVYNTLNSSGKALPLKEIFAGVKQRLPDRCDDSLIPCPYCKQKHPRWHHDTQWALQKLKVQHLVRRVRRGYWQALKPQEVTAQVPISAIPTEPESLHENLKTKIKDIGEVLGKQCHVEFSAAPYLYDVVWREVEGLPPSHVFEVQDKGSLNGALAKLQHAKDIWRPKLFLVVVEERDRTKVDLLLKPYLQGTFHRIAAETSILTREMVEQIHQVATAHRDVIRRFIED
jgi:hypothetical protein